MVVTTADRQQTWHFEGEGCTLNAVPMEVCRQRYGDLAAQATRELGASPESFLGVCAAVSGVDSQELRAACHQLFVQIGFPWQSLSIVNDCEVFLAAEDKPQAMVIVGTGSIAMAKDSAGQLHRKGGWGWLLSDEGSAYDIGMDVLRAVGNSLDGREQCPMLTRELREVYPVKDGLSLNAYAVEHISDKPAVARFAVVAAKAAEAGDPVARRILDRSAASAYALIRDLMLAMPTQDAARMLKERTPVLLWGSVLVQNRYVSQHLAALLEDQLGLSTAFPDTDALHMALRIAQNMRRKG